MSLRQPLCASPYASISIPGETNDAHRSGFIPTPRTFLLEWGHHAQAIPYLFPSPLPFRTVFCRKPLSSLLRTDPVFHWPLRLTSTEEATIAPHARFFVNPSVYIKETRIGDPYYMETIVVRTTGLGSSPDNATAYRTARHASGEVTLEKHDGRWLATESRAVGV